MDSDKLPRMKDISLTETITIEMPAWAWCFFVAEAALCDQSNGMIDWVADKAKRELYHPTTVNEQEARHQAMHDQQRMMQQHAFGLMGIPVNPHQMPGEENPDGIFGE